MTVLVLSPHPDDEMIGMGGTIAKYCEEGKRVVVVIFTKGEASHPWQRKESIHKIREKEAIQAGKIAGTAKTIFLDHVDGSMSQEIVEKNSLETLHKIIKKEKPKIIFMPAIDDVHKDHQAVANLMLAVHEQKKLSTPLWMYTVWNPWHIKSRNNPRMVVDISKTFRTKWKAIQAYKSQKVSTYQLLPTVLLRAFIHGIHNRVQLAEVFLQAK